MGKSSPLDSKNLMTLGSKRLKTLLDFVVKQQQHTKPPGFSFFLDLKIDSKNTGAFRFVFFWTSQLGGWAFDVFESFDPRTF